MGATPKQALVGGITAAALSVPMGPVLGYAVDVGRDLIGLKKNERPSYPGLLRRLPSRTKRGLAALLATGAIALTSAVYHFSPDKQYKDHNTPAAIQQTIENPEEVNLCQSINQAKDRYV